MIQSNQPSKPSNIRNPQNTNTNVTRNTIKRVPTGLKPDILTKVQSSN